MRLFVLIHALLIALACTVSAQSSRWHSTNLADAFLSCQPAPHPNAVRGAGHWILYDFGQVYRLTTTHFWNFNVPERTNSYNNEPWSLTRVKGRPEDGMKEILVEYSFDGVHWKEWTRFVLPMAPASPYYEGITGPDLGGLQTRYLLLTALSNHGGSCYGLSEVRFDVNEAPSAVSPIADNATFVKVQPNPLAGQALVSLNGFPEGDLTLQLADPLGRVLSEQKAYSSGVETEVLWTPGYHPVGFYVLHVIHEKRHLAVQVEIIP